MMNAIFSKFAQWAARQTGRGYTFAAAVLVIVVWAGTGPLFGWSDTWQLIINTGTTIVTFLMVFLIQNTQNRDTQAIQLKLDELIRVSTKARNRLVSLEDLTEEELDRVKSQFERLAEDAPPEAAEELSDAREDIHEVKGKLQRARRLRAGRLP
jgi:low affinity Fe/Cu permease